MNFSRSDLAEMILDRLVAESDRMHSEFQTPGRIPSAVLDNLLPAKVAHKIFENFPDTNRMVLKRSMKEHKHVAAQMNMYDPILEEAVYAFQDKEIVKIIGSITRIDGLEPDVDLYAGGISVMKRGGYLRPHLDNSHDGKQERYRLLNLLYYVTPEWSESHGGNLQLWDNGPLTAPRTIESQFNRLVLMITNKNSWHSVNEIVHSSARCCVSNYYFSKIPPLGDAYFHATSFRGEKSGVDDFVMQADNLIRTMVLKSLPDIYKNPHVYKRD